MIRKTFARALNQRQDAPKCLSDLLARSSSNAAPQMTVPSSEDTSKPLPYFRTRQNSPSLQTEQNSGQYYTLDSSIKKQLFLHGGFTKLFESSCKTFRETCLMIRDPALELMHYLKTTNFNNPITRYCLHGKYGTGKSTTLAHLLHYGLENNFVLVHVPWVPNWFKGPKEFSDCPTKEGFVDIPLDAAAWLIHFKNQNSRFLEDSQLTVSQDWEWSKRETTPKGSPISHIIETGINRVKYSTRCIEALLQELKQLSDQKKCKTLVVMDGFNIFFSNRTKIKTAAYEKLPPSRITITSPFVNMCNLDWSNGAVIVSLDDRAFFRDDAKNTDLPLGLLGNDGFKHLDPFIPIETKEYNDKEFNSCIDYYLDRKWIINPHAATELGRKELAFLSNRNPSQLVRVTAPL